MVESNNNTFSRERLAGYDPERINNSTVLIVGAGALGQNTALDLALSGIGEMRIVDRDRFEEHNRTRSPALPRCAAMAAPITPAPRTVTSRIAGSVAIVTR